MSSFSSKQAELQMNSCSSPSSTLEAVRVRDLTLPIDEGAFRLVYIVDVV